MDTVEHGWEKRNKDADRDKKMLIDDGTISYLPSASKKYSK